MPTYTENQMCHECGRLNCIIPKILISLNLTCEMLENLTYSLAQINSADIVINTIRTIVNVF